MRRLGMVAKRELLCGPPEGVLHRVQISTDSRAISMLALLVTRSPSADRGRRGRHIPPGRFHNRPGKDEGRQLPLRRFTSSSAAARRSAASKSTFWFAR